MTNVLFCETQTALRAKYGQRHGPATLRASARGEREHERHDQNARRFHQQPAAVSDRRCFIASAVYGADAWQVDVLRNYRDAVLMPSAAGRLLVHVYYWASPPLASVIQSAPWLRGAVGKLLDQFVDHRCRRQGDVHD